MYWAHRVADQFPDGQLYVNLRGFDPGGSRLDPAEALRGFLGALGVPAERIPADLPAQTGLYRSVLAGKRMLVVLDNAGDVDHVRPLLPGAPGCLAVVTSRNQLTPLIATEGAHPLTLDLLSTTEAHDLLVHRLGADRVAAEPDAVREIISRCTRLPLALTIVAARAAVHPTFPLAGLAADLRDVAGGLDALHAGDPGTDVRAVFSWSHQTLSAGAAGLFRLLGLHPGPDLTAAAAASLAGIPPRQARALLAELARAHLLTEHVPGRYTFHDLLRAYAIEQTRDRDSDDARRAAIHRTLDHYLHTAHSAALLLNSTRHPIDRTPPQPGVTPERLDDLDRASSWLSAEYKVLLAAADQAAATGFDTHTWQLAWCQCEFLYRRGQWAEQVAVQHTALDAARRLGNRSAQAHALCSLSSAHVRLGRLDDAETEVRLAAQLFADLGDPSGQARACTGLSGIAMQRDDPAEGLRVSRQALDLYRIADDQVGQALVLNSIGWFHSLLGDHHQALTYCRQALPLLQKLDYRAAEAATWDSLGHAYHHLADHQRAADCYQHAIDLHHSLGNPYEVACSLANLGDSHRTAGDSEAAHQTWQRALGILTDLHHPDANKVHAKLDVL